MATAETVSGKLVKSPIIFSPSRSLLEEADLDSPQEQRCAGVWIGGLHELLINLARLRLPAPDQFGDGRDGQVRSMLSAHERAAALRDAESEPRRGEVAVENQQVLGLHTFQNVFDQGPFLGVGVLAEHQVANQPQVRLQHHQGLPRQAGVEPLTQRLESMIGPCQNIAVEDPRPVARKNRFVGTW